jgi:hypothetical protein
MSHSLDRHQRQSIEALVTTYPPRQSATGILRHRSGAPLQTPKPQSFQPGSSQKNLTPSLDIVSIVNSVVGRSGRFCPRDPTRQALSLSFQYLHQWCPPCKPWKNVCINCDHGVDCIMLSASWLSATLSPIDREKMRKPKAKRPNTIT